MSEDSRAPTALGEEMLLPAMRWMAEQVPGGFFVQDKGTVLQDKGTVLLSYHAQDKRTVPLS